MCADRLTYWNTNSSKFLGTLTVTRKKKYGFTLMNLSIIDIEDKWIIHYLDQSN